MIKHPHTRSVVITILLAVGLAYIQAALPQAATPATAPASSSMPTTTSQPVKVVTPVEGVTEYLDKSKAVILKLHWKEKTFELVILQSGKVSDDRFARAGISGLGKGEAARKITGDFSIEGDHVLLMATSGLFEYSKNGSKMMFTFSDGIDTITNTKCLVLKRPRVDGAANEGSR